MGTMWTKPGDTIRITNTDSDHLGRLFEVIEAPEGSMPYDSMTWVWLEFKSGGSDGYIFYPGDYDIVEPTMGLQDAKENVDEFLSNQRDDNLRSIFG